MFPLNSDIIKTISENVAFIILISTFIGLVYNKVIKRLINFALTTWKRLEVAFGQLEHVHKEVSPNSGSSLYDKINKIQRELDIVRQDIVIQHSISRQIRDDMGSVPYCEFDVAGNLKFANKKLQSLVRMTEHQLAEMGWLTLIPEDARITVYSRWIDAMKTHTPFQATFDGYEGDLAVPYTLRTEQIEAGDNNPVYVIGKITKK